MSLRTVGNEVLAIIKREYPDAWRVLIDCRADRPVQIIVTNSHAQDVPRGTQDPFVSWLRQRIAAQEEHIAFEARCRQFHAAADTSMRKRTLLEVLEAYRKFEETAAPFTDEVVGTVKEAIP